MELDCALAKSHVERESSTEEDKCAHAMKKYITNKEFDRVGFAELTEEKDAIGEAYSDASQSKNSRLAKAAFRNLIKTGFLRKVDTTNDIFAVMSPYRVVGAFVREIMATLSRRKEYAVNGVPLERIQKEFAARKEFCKVSKGLLLEAIDQLLLHNEMYEVDSKTFKLLKYYSV